MRDLTQAYPQLAPDRDDPPLGLRSLEGKVSSDEWMRRLADRLDPSYTN